MAESKRPSNNRSLLACLACRRSKIRCDGSKPCTRCSKSDIGCVYLNPKNGRSTTEPHSAPTIDGLHEPSTGHSQDAIIKRHGQTITTILAKLGMTDELAEFARTIGAGEPGPSMSEPRMDWLTSSARPYRPTRQPRLYLTKTQTNAAFPRSLSPANDDDEEPNYSERGLIEAGLLSMQQAVHYFRHYQRHAANRVAVLPAISRLPSEPSLLRDVILTVGIRSSLDPETEAIHKACVGYTRARLISIGKAGIDDIVAALIFSNWYTDSRICRSAIGWGYELGLHHASSALRRLRVESTDTFDAAAISKTTGNVVKRVRTWLSSCAADMWLGIMAGEPRSVAYVEIALDDAVQWLDLKKSPMSAYEALLASHITDFDHRLISYVQIFLIVSQFRDALPLHYADPEAVEPIIFDSPIQQLVQQFDGVLHNWASRWRAGLDPLTDISSLNDCGIRSEQAVLDRHRLRVPHAWGRCYVHSIALRGIDKRFGVTNPQQAASIKTATASALEVVRWSLETKLYQSALSSSMEYMLQNIFGFAIDFISSALNLVPTVAFTEDLATLINRLPPILGSLREAGIANEIEISQKKVQELSTKVGAYQQEEVRRRMSFDSSPTLPLRGDIQNMQYDPTFFPLDDASLASLAGVLEDATFWLQDDWTDNTIWGSGSL